MPYRNMSLEDFAKYIDMDARDVQRLADRGKLPAQKVGGQWRFNRAHVTEWLQQEMPLLDEKRLATLERAMRDNPDEPGMVVTNLIGIEGIEIAFPARTRASVLRELVNLANRTGMLYDADGLLEALQAREELCSTALPNGVAIPHPRQPMPYVSAEPMICVARLSNSIAFGSSDGIMTSLFFLICCHEDRHHLRVLARLMRILDGDMVDQLMEADSAEDVLQRLIAKETQVLARTQ